MPCWDFHCKKCDSVNELHFKSYQASTKAKCAVCKSKLDRLPAVVQASFKGPGFYKTDYAAPK